MWTRILCHILGTGREFPSVCVDCLSVAYIDEQAFQALDLLVPHDPAGKLINDRACIHVHVRPKMLGESTTSVLMSRVLLKKSGKAKHLLCIPANASLHFP